LTWGGIPSPENRELVLAVAEEAGSLRPVLPVVLLREGDNGGWRDFWEGLGFAPLMVEYHEGLADQLLHMVGVTGRPARPVTPYVE